MLYLEETLGAIPNPGSDAVGGSRRVSDQKMVVLIEDTDKAKLSSTGEALMLTGCVAAVVGAGTT